ncbi:response regulator [Pseudochryseolinea flava]|uniref:Response regulatory domain-containing protein n=1 Tax=Pseudochryseolinea flava TaxID=2059302 RepID=A0A364Y075_9BACT|nr:response regulator [Pseudochryseolinea flava]RAV99997.1 hypothetical protein DQQ10_15680 [Pseudochryseolinea flava]
MRILVVEDQQVDRLIIKKQLSPAFDVTTLSSAIEAKVFARNNTFDVALLNVFLQEDMDGLELLKDLEVISAQSFLALAISAHVDDSRCQRLLNSGFKALLPKPFEREEFERLVAVFLAA